MLLIHKERRSGSSEYRSSFAKKRLYITFFVFRMCLNMLDDIIGETFEGWLKSTKVAEFRTVLYSAMKNSLFSAFAFVTILSIFCMTQSA